MSEIPLYGRVQGGVPDFRGWGILLGGTIQRFGTRWMLSDSCLQSGNPHPHPQVADALSVSDGCRDRCRDVHQPLFSSLLLSSLQLSDTQVYEP